MKQALIFAILVLAIAVGAQAQPGTYSPGSFTVSKHLLVKDSMRVQKTSIFNGAETFNGAATFTSTITTNLVVCDTNAFATTAQVDTVTITGASATDKYIATPRGAAATSNDVIGIEPTATGFIAHRPASGTSGLKYTWWRIK